MKLFKYLLLIIFLGSFLFLCKALFLGYYPDFTGYYFGPKVLLEGGNPYLARENFFTPFVYPPFVLLFFLPIVEMPFKTAEVAWTIISLVALFSSLFIFFKIYHQKLFSFPSLVIATLVCLFFPVKFSLGMGQINIIVLFLLTLGTYLYTKNKKMSGLFFGLPILLKFFPILLIVYFFIKKQWKMLIVTLCTIVTGILLSFFFLNSSVTSYFFSHVFPNYFSGWKGDYYNQSFSGVLLRAGISTDIGGIIRTVFTIFAIFVTFLAIFVTGKKKSIHITNLSIGAIMTISLLVNNFSWQHHFVWLLFPLITTFYAIQKIKRKAIYYNVTLGLSYILVAINLKHPDFFPSLIQSHVFWGGFLLWLLNIYFLFNGKEF